MRAKWNLGNSASIISDFVKSKVLGVDHDLEGDTVGEGEGVPGREGAGGVEGVIFDNKVLDVFIFVEFFWLHVLGFCTGRGDRSVSDDTDDDGRIDDGVFAS